MEKGIITKIHKTFEEYAYEQDGVDFWMARELQEFLGYADWRNFLNAVDKAKESCETAFEAISDQTALAQNQKLTELRDWLLPMLINGQVKVQDVEDEISMAAEENAQYGKRR